MGKEFKEEYNRRSKIVTPYAKIKRGHRDNGDYWHIQYLDPEDGEVHIGFSSYYRALVEKWLNEEFEVYSMDNVTPSSYFWKIKNIFTKNSISFLTIGQRPYIIS